MICEILHYLTYLVAVTHLYPKFLKVSLENCGYNYLTIKRSKQNFSLGRICKLINRLIKEIIFTKNDKGISLY